MIGVAVDVLRNEDSRMWILESERNDSCVPQASPNHRKLGSKHEKFARSESRFRKLLCDKEIGNTLWCRPARQSRAQELSKYLVIM
jgi:hypothetical protein